MILLSPNKGIGMRAHQLFKIVLITLSISLLTFISTLQAEPAQRIIIHFNKTLSATQKNEFHQYLNHVQIGAYTLTESSSDIRWIIVLARRLQQAQLDTLIIDIKKNKLVKQLEIDRLLQHQSVTSPVTSAAN